jgi:lipopolysaccharide/colanic/teichoic acid biosynthesis glycosyltransferase
MLALRVKGREVVEWPIFLEKLSGKLPIDNLSPSFIIFNEGFRKAKTLLALRQVVGVIVAAAALIVLLPFFCLIAILIILDSPGLPIYSQVRVGKNGKRFRIHKFRTMVKDAEENGDVIWAAKNDSRVTTFGRVLRRSRIDELPQLFNVLKGELDFVGPRPERPEFVEKLEYMIPY